MRKSKSTSTRCYGVRSRSSILTNTSLSVGLLHRIAANTSQQRIDIYCGLVSCCHYTSARNCAVSIRRYNDFAKSRSSSKLASDHASRLDSSIPLHPIGRPIARHHRPVPSHRPAARRLARKEPSAVRHPQRGREHAAAGGLPRPHGAGVARDLAGHRRLQPQAGRIAHPNGRRRARALLPAGPRSRSHSDAAPRRRLRGSRSRALPLRRARAARAAAPRLRAALPALRQQRPRAVGVHGPAALQRHRAAARDAGAVPADGGVAGAGGRRAHRLRRVPRPPRR